MPPTGFGTYIQLDPRIVGQSVEELPDMSQAAYDTHARLRPAFMAAGVAGHCCYHDYAGYLAAEDRHLERLFAIKAHRNSPANRLRLRIQSDSTDAVSEVTEQHRAALTKFADDLVTHLNRMLDEFEALT